MVPVVQKLAPAIERWMPTPAPDFERPKYLNEAAIDFADAAIEASRKVTVRRSDDDRLAILTLNDGKLAKGQGDVLAKPAPDDRVWGNLIPAAAGLGGGGIDVG